MATKEVEQIKDVELIVHEVEDNAVIVNVQGWRMRVYFNEGIEKDLFHYGQVLPIKYTGDIEDPHTIKFEKLV